MFWVYFSDGNGSDGDDDGDDDDDCVVSRLDLQFESHKIT